MQPGGARDRVRGAANIAEDGEGGGNLALTGPRRRACRPIAELLLPRQSERLRSSGVLRSRESDSSVVGVFFFLLFVGIKNKYILMYKLK